MDLHRNKLDGRRTRFFTELAKKHGVRLSALCLCVAVRTWRDYARGKRGQKAGWHQAADWFGKQIGIGRWQVYNLLEQGRRAKVLAFCRTRRGLKVWLKAGSLFASLKRLGAGDQRQLGYYYIRLASLLGVNGSVLYRFLRRTDEDGGSRYLMALGAEMMFPWMTAQGARDELMAYVWHVDDASLAVSYALTYAEAFALAEQMGWIRTPSWARGAYSTSQPKCEAA